MYNWIRLKTELFALLKDFLTKEKDDQETF